MNCLGSKPLSIRENLYRMDHKSYESGVEIGAVLHVDRERYDFVATAGATLQWEVVVFEGKNDEDKYSRSSETILRRSFSNLSAQYMLPRWSENSGEISGKRLVTPNEVFFTDPVHSSRLPPVTKRILFKSCGEVYWQQKDKLYTRSDAVLQEKRTCTLVELFHI